MSKKTIFYDEPPIQDLTWQAVYMDLITIVMVFFLILWALNNKANEKKGDITVNTVPIQGDKLFDTGKSRLKNGAESAINSALFAQEAPVPKLGEILDENGETTSRQKILMIYGHTDDVGNHKTNMRLGFERAFSVYERVIQKRDDFEGNVSVCTHGSNFPRARVEPVPEFLGQEQKKSLIEDNVIARQYNRRVTFELINKNVELEEVDE